MSVPQSLPPVPNTAAVPQPHQRQRAWDRTACTRVGRLVLEALDASAEKNPNDPSGEASTLWFAMQFSDEAWTTVNRIWFRHTDHPVAKRWRANAVVYWTKRAQRAEGDELASLVKRFGAPVVEQLRHRPIAPEQTAAGAGSGGAA